MKRILLCCLFAALASGQKFASVAIRVESTEPIASAISPRLALQTKSIFLSYVSMHRLLREAFPTYASWPQIQIPFHYDTNQHYSLSAIPPSGYKPADVPKMMQSMLADKFGMTTRTVASAPTSILSLQPSQRTKLTAPRAASKSPTIVQLPKRVDITVPSVDGTPDVIMKGVLPDRAPTHYEITGSMSDLAAFLSDHTHYVVRDDTKITGNYAFKFDVFTPNSTTLDPTGHMFDEQVNRQWRSMLSNFQMALESIGLELFPATQNLPNVIITKLDQKPKP